MWLISEDRKRAVNTESKVEIYVTHNGLWQVAANILTGDPSIVSGHFIFATCDKEYDALEALVAITLLSMDTVVAKTPIGLTYKRCDLHTPDIEEYLASSIKDIIIRTPMIKGDSSRGIKDNS